MDLSDASHDTNAISLLMAEEKDESNAGKNSHINFQMPHPLDANTKAVVPYQEFMPRPISSMKWLGPDLDLNVPPENWLRAGSPLEKCIQKVLYNKQKNSHMSSLIMAHSKVELIDSIDVISDAKNIKSLLAMPFAQDQPLSLMVHRIGKTLLIDEFDIHKHLFRKQQQDWKWMRKFYMDLVMQQQGGKVPRQHQSLQKLNERNMFSKFLYYSIMSEAQQAGQSEASPATNPSELAFSPQFRDDTHSLEADFSGVGRHDTSDDDEFYFSDDSELGEDCEFAQHVQWKFEDMKMMIGTDLPIFTDKSSCVSLRLRDSNSPITVLTGLEYWLDNLMCNVPEIAMCYHLGGFVQKYERFPTHQIPNLRGSEFKPEFVKDIAQNIWSFLKSNATKVGHTYWLYKEKNGDIVKLYDLTSLYNEENNQENPFRHPLAHLLFRVALKLHRSRNRSKSGLIHSLLTNCLTLAPEAKPHIAVTANVILCELYLTEDDTMTSTDLYKLHTDSQSDSEDDNMTEDDSNNSSSDSDLETSCHTLNVRSLSKTDSSARSTPKDSTVSKFPPISGSSESRCQSALSHIAQGLKLIDQDIDAMEMCADSSKAKPGVAIPLPYEPLHPVSMDTSVYTPAEGDNSARSSESTVQIVNSRLKLIADTWHRQSKAVLLSKTMFACYKLADSYNIVMEYGNALKYVKIAMLCYDSLNYLDNEVVAERHELFIFLVRLCGDIQLKLGSKSNIDRYRAEYQNCSMDEDAIVKSIANVLADSKCESLYHLDDSIEKRLLTSLQCYEICERDTTPKSEKDNSTLVRRLGNCCNELSKFYMDNASHVYNDSENDLRSHSKLIDDMLNASGVYLDKGVAYFQTICDTNNVALLTSNSARLLRIRAQVIVSSERGEFTPQERTLYNQAAERYLEALSVLNKRENCPQIWNLITFELSGVYCTIASLLQDYTPLSMTSRDEVERDVTNLMLKALKYCDNHEATEVMRQYRAATIHHRLASLFHNSYRNSVISSEARSRQLRSMTESHYAKAASLFSCLESYTELLRVLLERVALYEFYFHSSSSPQAKFRHMESALSQLVDNKMKQCLIAFTSSEHLSQTDENEVVKLLNIFTGRLQFVTLNLVKLSSQQANQKKSVKQDESLKSQMDRYKQMYRQSLAVKNPSDTTDCLQLSNQILAVYQTISHQTEVT